MSPYPVAPSGITGHRREEVLGRTHWEVYPASVGTPLEREFRRTMDERVEVEFENHYAPWDRWFALKASPASEGGICVQYRDVTAAKRAEAPLRNALQILGLRGGDPTVLGRVRGMMDRQVTHLSRLVDDLLDVCRITTGNRDAADSQRILLEAYGYEVEVAYTGPDGVRAA